jgi:hypothetical protein
MLFGYMLLFNSINFSYMKKLLFLIPLALLILNATPLAIFKDSVNYIPNGHLFSLEPSSWKQLSYKIIKRPYQQSTYYIGSSGTTPATEPLSQGARIYGFPISFYLKKNNVVNVGSPNPPAIVSAYNWHWALIDGLIIIVTLVFTIFINLHRSTKQILKTGDSQIG